MTTLREVAAAAGVSTVTASSVLSGADRVRVSEKTATRIRETARSLNYVPRAAARGLRLGKVDAIGFVTSAHSLTRWQAHWQEVLRGVSDVLWERDEKLVLSLPKSDDHEIEVLRQLLFGHQVDGLIIQNCQENDPRLDMFRVANIPFVALGGEADDACHVVTFDTSGFAEILCRHRAERTGALGIIAAKPQSRENREFLEGCRNAAQALTLPYMEWTGPFVPEAQALRQARQAAGDKPLRIILTRHLLPELLAALASAGLVLQKDIRLTYIAGAEELALTPPGLDVIPLDYYTLGRRATKLLFQLIEAKESAPPPSRLLVLPGIAEYLVSAPGQH